MGSDGLFGRSLAWRLTVGCLVGMALLLAGVAIGTADRDGDPAGDRGVESAPRPASDDAPSSPPELVLERGERPQVDLTGEDFDRIVRDLARLADWLARNPDPDLVDLVWHPDGPDYERFRDGHAQAQQDGLRDASRPARILSVEVVERPADDLVVVRVVQAGAPQYMVNDRDEVVTEVPAEGVNAFRETLRRDERGRWRVVESIPEAP